MDMTTSLKPTLSTFESLFSKLNDQYFEGELQPAVIAVAPDAKKRAYGWCTGWKAWGSGRALTMDELVAMSEEEIERLNDEGFYEINICAEYLTRPLTDVVGTLLHEMVHLYNLQIGVKDTSRNGYYHNKAYRDAALTHGLNCYKEGSYGYCRTKLNDEAEQFVRTLGDISFDLYRKPMYRKGGNGTGGAEESDEPKQTSRKYVCPSCGNSVRSTKEVHIKCMDCDLPMKWDLKEKNL